MTVRLRTHLVVLHLWLPKGILGIAGSPSPRRINASLSRLLKVVRHVSRSLSRVGANYANSESQRVSVHPAPYSTEANIVGS